MVDENAGRPRRPARLTPGMMDFFASESLDPAVIIQVADESAAGLVRAGRASDDPEVTTRLVALVDEIGLSTIAELWSQRPRSSLPGLLWRLYALREWVRCDPAGASRDYQAGLAYAGVAAAVAGAPDTPGPHELSALVDEILRGVFDGDLGVALHRAAAFCRVVSAGRASHEGHPLTAQTADTAPPVGAGGLTGRDGGDPWSSQLRRAAAIQVTADDLEAGARAWRDGGLV
ncbi:MAG: hypothetical protein Q4P32_07975 [Micrococcales bacterium]|nr:hypothetical protein [Micrococcales bacterium]